MIDAESVSSCGNKCWSSLCDIVMPFHFSHEKWRSNELLAVYSRPMVSGIVTLGLSFTPLG